MSEHLFAAAIAESSSDEVYTPRWVFDAMGLAFDLDVAAPRGGPWHVPAAGYFSTDDDGLEQPWEGSIWCNPPFSNFAPWAEKWAAHDRGVLLGLVLPQVLWTRAVMAAADAVVLSSLASSRPGRGFVRPDGSTIRFRQPTFLAFRGVGTEPAERLAAADPYGAVLYGRAVA